MGDILYTRMAKEHSHDFTHLSGYQNVLEKFNVVTFLVVLDKEKGGQRVSE